jgi:hypothetical protein
VHHQVCAVTGVCHNEQAGDQEAGEGAHSDSHQELCCWKDTVETFKDYSRIIFLGTEEINNMQLIAQIDEINH